MADKKKLHIAVVFGGGSSEHEGSLMSARSVLSVLDPSKYEITQIGITSEGKWLTGPDVIGKFEGTHLEGLDTVMISADQSVAGLLVLRGRGWEKLFPIDVIFPDLHGTFGQVGKIHVLFELP